MGSNWRLHGFGRTEEVMIMKMMMLAMVVMVRLIGKGYKEKIRVDTL